LNISLKTNFYRIDRVANVRACTHRKLIPREPIQDKTKCNDKGWSTV